MVVHIGASWRIRLNRSCGAAMRPFRQITLTTYYWHGLNTVGSAQVKMQNWKPFKLLISVRINSDTLPVCSDNAEMLHPDIHRKASISENKTDKYTQAIGLLHYRPSELVCVLF